VIGERISSMTNEKCQMENGKCSQLRAIDYRASDSHRLIIHQILLNNDA
jgi:hypothetical protein